MVADDLAAARALPGPDYYTVLEWIHAALRPITYVEIGVHSGKSLALARPDTFAIGIDPSPQPGDSFADSRIIRLTSSGFFRRYDLRQLLGGKAVDFALVDGLHLFEQAIEDLCNLERYIAPGGMIAVHDTIPLNRETSARVRTTEFYTGDVWKMVPYLCQHRPDLEIVTVLTAPTGLTLIRKFGLAQDDAGTPGSIDEFKALEFDYFERNQQEFLRTIPNQRPAVDAFCQNTPVQSIASSGVAMPSC